MTPARLRLRRRLLVASALPALVVLMVAAKLISVVIAGNAAQRDFAAGRADAMATDVAILQMLDVIEPSTTAFAAGSLAVLDEKLDAADRHFTESLAATAAGASCAVRVNLALVRERQGDIDAWEARLDAARTQYDSALGVIAAAPSGCFAGNQDPDPQRRAVREDAAARIEAKIRGLGTVTPLTPPSPPAPPVAAAPPPPAITDVPDSPRDERQLEPEGTDPLDTLRRLLGDAAGG
ncbi:hypothetical protein [Mycobacterium sp. SMC-4]|uniref:hypothetical protein n=1 Tax=Mycobacterium sp. SMC-4 TaxID=2857059 RepID=UPI0021B39E79|nr:hypothetical protein [Mycobacterium sp. SMC-4]UXA18684.1 hypothetical protein KXD98_02980 [Mycobacterium sp. SMC-4]